MIKQSSTVKPKYKVGDFFIPAKNGWGTHNKFVYITRVTYDKLIRINDYDFISNLGLDSAYESFFTYQYIKVGNVKDSKLIRLFYT
jgi:hypothetical protein